ncbi:MAG TPA: GNAT family N-acetyltransferase [Thermoleophilaceae bacterium]|nr:GNAT family N-acetyltransferase [Thermoleophilaceae bacterium]
MDVTDLRADRFDEASIVMADAFMDDPGWSAVGPDDPARRHRYIRRVCRGVLNVCARRGGRIWQVERDGRTVGVLSSLDPGQWPPPPVSALVAQALGPVLAGPAVLLRSLGADQTMHKGHPADPHLFVWMLTVAPAAQRSGVGRALLSTAIARAEELDVPTYLDTAKPANLPYYGSFGFQPTSEAPLPRGATLWFMFRDMQ